MQRPGLPDTATRENYTRAKGTEDDNDVTADEAHRTRDARQQGSRPYATNVGDAASSQLPVSSYLSRLDSSSGSDIFSMSFDTRDEEPSVADTSDTVLQRGNAESNLPVYAMPSSVLREQPRGQVDPLEQSFLQLGFMGNLLGIPRR